MKKLLIYIIVGIVVVGAGIGIAYAAGLFDKDKKTDTPIAVTSVTIDGESSIVANDPATYTAVVLPADATDKTVTWAVSSGQATITADGVLTATSAGTVIITATSNNSKVGMKTITVYADQTTADNAAITAARNAIENASYTVSQTDVIDIETANAFIETIINGLSLNGVTVEISEYAFNAAIAGTPGDTDGTNGSYTFSVTLNKGVGTEQYTETITLTITAIPYDSEVEEQDNAAIDAAKSAIEGATYTANQSAAADIVTAKTSIQAVINGLSLDGVHYTIINGTFTAATAGTVSDADGANGSFEFTVKLNKGLGAEQITSTLTLTITATAYDSTEQDNLDIAAVKTAIEDATYSAVAQEDINDIAAARAAVQAVIDTLSLNGVSAVIVDGVFTPAIAGTANDHDGTNGSFPFTVKLNKNNGTEQITNTLTLTITATPYDSTTQDNLDIAAAKLAIESETYTAPQAEVTDISTANAFIQSVFEGLSLNDVTTEIPEDDFNPAIAGNAVTPNGTNGSYTFAVTLNKGNGDEQITITLTLTITATPYDSTAQDNTDIAAAKSAIEGASYNATQTTVTDTASAKTAVQTVISGLSLNGVAAIIVDGIFTDATAGTTGDTDGTNGSFTFTVKLNKGLGTEQITSNLTLNIIATPFDNAARVDGAKAAIEDILDNDAVYSSANCGGVGGETTTIRLYIEGLISDVDDLYGVNLGVSVQEVIPAVDDTIVNADGVNGSAKFTVQIVYGANVISDSVVKEITIVAADNFTDDNTIENAQIFIRNAFPPYVPASLTYNSLNGMQSYVSSLYASIINSHNVIINRTNENFEPAVNGTMPDIGSETVYIGKDGVYTCTLTISKNSGTPMTVEVSIAITARDYSTTGAISYAPITIGGVNGYEVYENGLTDVAVVIPAEYLGLPVLKIQDAGFNSLSNIKLVIIPDGMKEIGVDAFNYCSALKSVIIPNSVEIIASGAFQDCAGLESITLPENQNYTTITSNSFRGTGLKSIVLPGKVTTIEGTAFFGCAELTSITMDGVTTISNGAFNGCSKLVDLTLSQNVESIGGAAFYGINIIIHIENPNIEFRGNVFQTNTVVEIYFSGTQVDFENLFVHNYNSVTGVSTPTATTVHSTLPAKTKVYFNDGTNNTYNL